MSTDKARQDPAIVRNAGVALDKAGQALEGAERLWANERDRHAGIAYDGWILTSLIVDIAGLV